MALRRPWNFLTPAQEVEPRIGNQRFRRSVTERSSSFGLTEIYCPNITSVESGVCYSQWGWVRWRGRGAFRMVASSCGTGATALQVHSQSRPAPIYWSGNTGTESYLWLQIKIRINFFSNYFLLKRKYPTIYNVPYLMHRDVHYHNVNNPPLKLTMNW
jgi:hypothetical protein